jgi:hypothetical protein
MAAKQGFIVASRSLWPFALAMLQTLQRHMQAFRRLIRFRQGHLPLVNIIEHSAQMRLPASEIKPLAARRFPFAFRGNVT